METHPGELAEVTGPGVRSTYSVPSPLLAVPKYTSFYYASPYNLGTLEELAGFPVGNESSANPHILTLIKLCILNGARIGELLRLTAADVIGHDVVLVHGEKHSRDYTITLPGLSAQLKAYAKFGPKTPLFPFKYKQVYDTCVRIGLGAKMGQNSNTTRTHLGRYKQAQGVVSKKGLTSGSDVLRHRSSKTIQYYLKEGV